MSGGLRGLCRDTGGVILAWASTIALEFVVVSAAWSGRFAGSWELIVVRKLVAPIALAMAVPLAVLAVGVGHLAARAARDVRARVVLAMLSGAFGASVAFLVSGGRHFSLPLVRGLFVVTLFTLGFALAYAAAIPLVRALGSARGRALALGLGLGGTAAFWLLDASLLPRLYPGFHDGVFALTLAASALVSLAWRPRESIPTRGDLLLGVSGLLLGAAALAWTPFAARRLARSDNVRIVLAEHAPILGRAVALAARISPPAPLDADPATDTPLARPGEVPRSLDWSGDDVLLISVDALRADHVSAYGYGRATTPNLDALAKEGALFLAAYCPTPHTSYSVTSMMTGKAMRPLLALGLGQDSDTWATDLRRYGYRTAAFYPPAVFYIDRDRFKSFEESGLGFEYRWVEFTSAEEKAREVARYLETAPAGPLFVWVHLFEPHEPYVAHPPYRFGGDVQRPVDVYDSEVAYADGAIGELVKTMRAHRPRTAIIVTADHGEEFGEHGGRYHGTTCYEEQVRVPLVVVGPGVPSGRVATVVQTIDLLPTVLSAMGIPRPARLSGKDLGPVLAAAGSGSGRGGDLGLAYAETDDQTLLARGSDRLVCARRLAACALYDVASDPMEHEDRAAADPGRVRDLRGLLGGIERAQGRYEAAEVQWPDALRRGMQGEVDAASDVAALLDDASVVIRRKAAEVTFQLAAPAVVPEVRRAAEHDEDPEVASWCALSLVRMREPAPRLAGTLLFHAEPKWRRAAALAFALAGDGRGRRELAAFWAEAGPPHPGLDVVQAKELLVAIGRVRATEAVPALLESLDYVPIRPFVAETLGQIGDRRALPLLMHVFETEHRRAAWLAEAHALAALGAGPQLGAPPD